MIAVDLDSVRAAHRMFPTGVTVVTTMDGDQPRGLAVNAFCSVSLEPPTVLVCVSRSSRSRDALVRATTIGINLLASDQEQVAQTFAGRGDDKFSRVPWELGSNGAPLLRGAAAFFEVTPTTIAMATTHLILIGEVVSCGTGDQAPLLYLGGQFSTPIAPSPAA